VVEASEKATKLQGSELWPIANLCDVIALWQVAIH
jgi:hypothetical protein